MQNRLNKIQDVLNPTILLYRVFELETGLNMKDLHSSGSFSQIFSDRVLHGCVRVCLHKRDEQTESDMDITRVCVCVNAFV